MRTVSILGCVLATKRQLKSVQRRVPCLGMKLLAQRSYGCKDKIQWDLCTYLVWNGPKF
jgi:hypothetical protein